jgi:hypothetical protein
MDVNNVLKTEKKQKKKSSSIYLKLKSGFWKHPLKKKEKGTLMTFQRWKNKKFSSQLTFIAQAETQVQAGVL